MKRCHKQSNTLVRPNISLNTSFHPAVGMTTIWITCGLPTYGIVKTTEMRKYETNGCRPKGAHEGLRRDRLEVRFSRSDCLARYHLESNYLPKKEKTESAFNILEVPGVKNYRDILDNIFISSVLEALGASKVPSNVLRILAKIFVEGSICPKVGEQIARAIHTCRGLRQGRVCSMFNFVLTVARAVHSQIDEWRKRGVGFVLDGRWLGFLNFADDFLVVAKSFAEMRTMFEGLRA